MVARRPILRTAAAGVIGLTILPAVAQDVAQGGDALRMRFGIEERLEYATNQALTVPAEDPTATATTRLSFDLTSETQTEQLVLSTQAALRLKDGPGGSEAKFDDPRLRLSYARDAANATLGFDASYRRTEVDFLRPLLDFVNDEGVIVLPEDLSDLTGTGTRASYAVGADIEFGTSAPLGLALTAELSGIDYTDATNPNLVNIRRTRLGATAKLRFSEVSQGRIGLKYATYDADDAPATHRETSTFELGLDSDLSESTALETTLGYNIIDTEEFGVTSRTDGLIGRIGIDRAMPNGNLTASVSATTNQDGTRLTLEFGRALDLPDGALAATIGLTQPEGGDVSVIGSLFWSRDLPDGQITAQIDRSVSASNTDVERLTTLVSVGYGHEINAVSGLQFNAAYAMVGDPSLDRADLTATYRREMTEDWDMNFGLAYRMREVSGAGRAESQSVFMSLSRSIEF